MSTPFASILLLCPAQFDTMVTKYQFCADYVYITVYIFTCVDILILKYLFKFAEFKHQVCIASESYEQ